MSSFDSSSLAPSDSVLVSPAEWDPDDAVVWLRGEHDISTIAWVSEVLVQAIALNDAYLVVDLSEVSFMDAATVGVIIRTREHLRLRSQSLVLRSPSRFARRVLDLCGISDFLAPDPVPTPTTDPANALRSWVVIPPSDPIERGVEPSAPMPVDSLNPMRVDGGPDTEDASLAGGHELSGERPTSPAGSGSA